MNENEQNINRLERRLKKWDLIIKTFGALIIAVIGGFITLIGYKMESSRTASAEHDKAITAIRDSWVKQKELDLNVGMKMFETLITQFLQKSTAQGSSESKTQQLLLLRLISLNFQDTPIKLRPLYEQLDRQLVNKEQKVKLREIAMEVAQRQAFRMTFQNGWQSGKVLVKKDDSIDLAELPYKIKVKELGKEQLRVELISLGNQDQETPLEFGVDYFDMPLVDNTKLGDKRISVLQLDNDGKKATIRIITFDSYLAADRFDIKEMTKDYEQTNFGMSQPKD